MFFNMKIIKNTNLRQSNFELLRIVSMFAILLSHILIHGFAGIENFSQSSNYIFHQFVNSFLMIHVNLFLLISGYFGIKFKWESLYNLLSKCFFYSVSIYVIWHLCNGTSLTIHDILGRASFIYKKNPWWFVYVYIQLFMVSPILNIVIRTINKTQYLKILSLLLFLNCVIGGLLKSDFNPNGFTLQHFILMYFIGGYIRKYNLFYKIKSKKLIGGYLCSSLSVFLLAILPIHTWSGYVNPFVILGSVLVFIVFKNFTFQSKIINWFSASAFSVYLLHDEDTIVRGLMAYIGNYTYLYTDVFLIYFPVLIIVAIVIFFIAVLIDKCCDYILAPFSFIGKWKPEKIISRKISVNEKKF